MKLLICGDLHLDEKKPKNRTETYVEDQKDKMTQIMNLARYHKAKAILQPGDFFNTPRISDKTKTFWIEFFKSYKIPILTVPGQHDMRYHSSDIDNTPLGVLQAAEVVTVIGAKLYHAEQIFTSPQTYIYGAGWEQDIPKPEHAGINILLLHMLISSTPLYPGHSNIHPGWILDKYKYDLIVTGDNHKHFTYQSPDGRWLINCGSLMRSSIDQEDHHPFVYIYDTESKTPTFITLKAKLFEEVMNLEEAEKEKERNKELEDFVEGLSDTNIDGLDFKKNLIHYLKDNKDKIGNGVIKIINELVGD